MTRSVAINRGKTNGGRVVFWSEFGVCADVFKNSAREGRRHCAARRRRPAPMKTTDLRYYIRVSEKTALYNIYIYYKFRYISTVRRIIIL